MNSNKKLNIWTPLLFSITLIAGMMIGYRMKEGMPGKRFFSVDKTQPIQELLDLLRNRYVDTLNVDALADTAITAILGKLDPHSVFISAEEVEETNQDIAGNFFGIGIEFEVISDTINIVYVVPDGPAAKAGMLSGDKIIKAGDSLTAGVKINYSRIKKLLRGASNSTIALEILRGAEKKKITVQRGIIPVSSIDAAYMIEPGTGYIRLNKFTQKTYREFMERLEKLKNEGMQQLILDLRDNGGGVLDQATEIADEFLEGDKLIAYTEGAHFPRKQYRCKRPGLFEKGKLLVLADEGSASASEILIGALQDWERATVIGRRTFGKGLVQEQYDLSDGSALRLTIARYYTPVGRSIQRSYSQGGKAYYNDIMNRYHDGEMMYGDSIKNDTSRTFNTPSGKKLYGGGGITPDVFVPLDTTKNSKTISALYMKGTFGTFAYQYFIAHKTSLEALKKAEDINTGVVISDESFRQFQALAAKDSIVMGELSAAEKNEVVLQIKIMLARQLWRSEGLYRMLNTSDEMVKKALTLAKQ